MQTEIVNLRRAVNFKRLAREVSWRYRPALSSGELQMTVGRQPVEPAELPADERSAFSREIAVEEVTVTVTGWVGLAPAGFDCRGGIRCSAFGRVVLQHEYFGHRTSSFKASMNSLVGEVDLSFVPVVLNKNAFDTASSEWEAAQAVMHDEMEPYVRRLLKRRDPGEPSDEERLRAMEAHDIAQRALERIAAETLEHGRGGRQVGRKPPTRREPRPDAQDAVEIRERDRAEPKPKTPPPPGAVGKLERRGLSIDWDVRPLDPHIRSAREAQDGRTEIVINNLYPLYRRRNGDLLYILETGLFEQLKPNPDEDLGVAAYHDQFVEALYHAVSEATGVRPVRAG